MNNILESVLSGVKKQNAECDLLLTKSKSLKMSVQKGALSTYNVTSSQVLGLRLIKDNKVGIAFTEALDKESLNFMVSQALQNAELNAVNEYEDILSLSGEIHDVKKSQQESISTDDKISKVLELESLPKKWDSRVVAVPYNGYTEQEYESIYMSSRGRKAFYADNSYSIHNSILLDENNQKSTFYDFHQAYSFQDLKWDKVIRTALSHAQNLLAARSISTGKYEVQLTSDVLQSLFNVFNGIFSAKGAKDKVNPWRENLGEMVTSSDLSIEDHPLYSESFRISKFDSEGFERRPMHLVENGILKNFYHNSSTAGYFKTQTTGHAARAPQGSLGVGGTDLIIHGKNPSSKPAKFLEVIQLDGLHAGTNRITGDFSLPVKGYLWEGGERKEAFSNVTLSGNFYQMLKHVTVTGTSPLASTDQCFFSVPLIFNELSIAGI
jgi:PmbA protein